MAYQTVNPYTNELVREFATATDEEVDAAIGAAHEAFRSWRNVAVKDRVAVLARAAELLRENKRAYAQILTLEMGKIIAEAQIEVDICIGMLEYYVEHGEKLLEPVKVVSNDPAADNITLVSQPLGVLYCVEPWNFPYYQVIRVAAPQLTAGNTIVLKHASNVPQSALAMEKLFLDAGAPKGLLVNLFAGHDATDRILADPRIRGAALTGSGEAGGAVAVAAAKNLKKSTLELGGADAFIVLDDADLDKTVDWAVMGRHWNGGQVCVSAKRMIIVESVYDAFVEKYRAGVAKLVAGDPMDPATQLAPLSSQSAKDGLKKQLADAVAGGATAEQVGAPVPEQGCFFQPTILTNMTPDNPMWHAEFFGPVSMLIKVKDEAEAIAVANDSPYGLGGSVWTRDEARGFRVSEEIDTGMMFVNHPTMVKADVPFGGVKGSGYGHELTDLGIAEFLNKKVIGVADIDKPF